MNYVVRGMTKEQCLSFFESQTFPQNGEKKELQMIPCSLINETDFETYHLLPKPVIQFIIEGAKSVAFSILATEIHEAWKDEKNVRLNVKEEEIVDTIRTLIMAAERENVARSSYVEILANKHLITVSITPR